MELDYTILFASFINFVILVVAAGVLGYIVVLAIKALRKYFTQ